MFHFFIKHTKACRHQPVFQRAARTRVARPNASAASPSPPPHPDLFQRKPQPYLKIIKKPTFSASAEAETSFTCSSCCLPASTQCTAQDTCPCSPCPKSKIIILCVCTYPKNKQSVQLNSVACAQMWWLELLKYKRHCVMGNDRNGTPAAALYQRHAHRNALNARNRKTDT